MQLLLLFFAVFLFVDSKVLTLIKASETCRALDVVLSHFVTPGGVVAELSQ